MHHNIKRSSALALALGVALAGGMTAAQATEGGSSSWPNGIEQHGAGILPPPGIYGQVFAGNYLADTLRDNAGNKAAEIDLRVTSVTPRFVWVTEHQVLGGQLGFHALLPMLDMRLNIKNGGPHDSKRGIGDLQFGPVLGYHLSDKLHIAAGADVLAPTGSYNKHDIINLGTNYYTAQSTFALTYLDPNGFNADLRLMYDYNFENKDTNYTSGQELHLDYTVGWGLGNGWTVGVGGHAYTQVTDDKCSFSNCEAAASVRDADGNRGRTLSIGPAFQYVSKDGWMFSAKWQEESGVRNRAEGQAYWFKFTTAL